MARRSFADMEAEREQAKTAKAAKQKVINKPNVIQETIDELVQAVNNTLFDEKQKIQFLSAMGVGTNETEGKYFTCSKCGRLLPRNKFYMSSEVGVATHLTPICMECATDLAEPIVNGERQLPSKDSVTNALDFLRKPYLEKVWEASQMEAANNVTGKTKGNVWKAYIKNIQMPQYYGLNHSSSDFYTEDLVSSDTGISKNQEIVETFEKNKSDTLRLLGYLPFEKEKESDQPFLYAQLIGFLDASEEQNDDMMRTSSIISIVRGFLQQSQIDDMIAQLVQDSRHAQQNVPTIKALQSMKSNITNTITQLAKESCISLKNTKNAKKGENTWTGKLKKIKDMNLREGEVNGFDLNTCKGMQQVMEMSDASIMKQLRLDESEWSDMVAEQRSMIRDLQKKLDFYAEASRIILRENLDLRDTLTENGIALAENLVDLDELYSPFIADFQSGAIEDDIEDLDEEESSELDDESDAEMDGGTDE